MRIVSEADLVRALEEHGAGAAAVGEVPRIVASGNFATPQRLVQLADSALERYRIFALNAQVTLPDRDGVIYETPFVGPAMRQGGDRLDYVPMRLSLVPQLFQRSRPPDVVILHTSPIRAAGCRSGSRSTSCRERSSRRAPGAAW